jgi:hypothetical protein
MLDPLNVIGMVAIGLHFASGLAWLAPNLKDRSSRATRTKRALFTTLSSGGPPAARFAGPDGTLPLQPLPARHLLQRKTKT